MIGKYEEKILSIIDKDRNGEKLSFYSSLVDLFEEAEKDGILIFGFKYDGKKETDLEDMRKDAYKEMSDFYLRDAFRGMYSDIPKKEVGDCFKKGVKYAEKAGEKDKRKVKAAKKIMSYYTD